MKGSATARVLGTSIVFVGVTGGVAFAQSYGQYEGNIRGTTPIEETYRETPRFEFENPEKSSPPSAFRRSTVGDRQQRRTAELMAEKQLQQAEQGRQSYLDAVLTRPIPEPQQTMPLRVAQTASRPVAMTEVAQAQPVTRTRTIRSVSSVDSSGVIPPMPTATPGECYALVRVPEQYRNVQRRVVVKPESSRIEVIPPKYRTVKKRVVVQDGYERLEVIPAKFSSVSERVEVRPSSSRYTSTPAQYGTVTERVLVKPARQVWKKGRGPIEKMDHATGEILCLIEEPAQYKTITKQVLKTPAAVREVTEPAQYRTVSRQVVAEPAKVRRVQVAPKVRDISITEVAEPARTREVAIPAKYTTITERELVQAARLEWRPILCETNTTPGVVREIQSALKSAGFNPGPIDGVIGAQTRTALGQYQRKNGLPVDRYLNMQTLRSLGIRMSGGSTYRRGNSTVPAGYVGSGQTL